MFAREHLGSLLLELDRPAGALRQYEGSLETSPDRFNALHGAAHAASLAGDDEKARAHYERLLAIVAEDAREPAIEEARRFVRR